MTKFIECTKTVYIVGETKDALSSSDFTITVENNKDSIYINNGLHFSLFVARADIKELYEALMEIDKLTYTKVS